MGGKSKSATVGYWYEVAFHSGLGIGPIDAYLEFRGGDKTAWRGEATQSQTIHINAPNLWGGEKDQGGIVGSVDLMFGEATQQPNSRLAGIFGPQQPAWRGFATLAFTGKYGAMNPYPQKASHKIRKIREGWPGECWHPGKAAIPMPTCSGGDPYIHVTSPPYPVELVDGIAHDSDYRSGKIVPQPAPMDGLMVSSTLVEGALRDVLRLYAHTDSIAFNSTLLSGQLKRALVPFAIPSEGINHSSALQTGTLEVVLIPYAIPSEGINHSSTIVSGALA